MKSSSSHFFSTLNRDKFLILVCVVLAFFGWQGIKKNIGLEQAVSDVSIDIEVPKGWAVWEKSAQSVNVNFRGSRDDIRFLNNEQLRVIIDVPDPKDGQEMVIKLNESHLRNPTGAKVVSFIPSEIVVRLDEESEKVLSVKAAYEGELAEGFDIERIECTPQTVHVYGAKNTLAEMTHIYTEPVQLKDRNNSFKASVPIALPSTGRMVVDPDWVSVEFVLEERNSEETFENIPLRIMCASGEVRAISATPRQVTVFVRGRSDTIEKMRETELFAYVNCDNLMENTSYELPISINLPEGVQVIKTDPLIALVNITEAK